MRVIGFKSFFNNHTLIDGKIYKEGIVYHQDGEIIVGHNGFHLCKNIEDTLMYFNKDDNIEIALVLAWGVVHEFNDDYRTCYNMYVSEYLKIIKFLSRKEIIIEATKLNDFSLIKFLTSFKLNEDEITLFEGRNSFIDLIIDYYQRNIKEAFEPEYKIKKLKSKGIIL